MPSFWETLHLTRSDGKPESSQREVAASKKGWCGNKLEVMIKRGEFWDGVCCHAIVFSSLGEEASCVRAVQITKTRATPSSSSAG